MKVFSNREYQLAEGPLWSPFYGSFFWVDIITQQVFGKKIINENPESVDFEYKFNFIPSALIHDTNSPEHFWIVADTGLHRIHPKTGHISPVLAFELPKNFRTNDAGVDGNGNLWVGVMEKNPSGLNGWVFVLNNQGMRIGILPNIGIPNTFCHLANPNIMLITDSFQQKTFALPCSNVFSTERNKWTVWQNLTDTPATPDGGCVDARQYVWNAHWDGSRVRLLGPSGNKIQDLPVPAQQVTSCCIGGDKLNQLLITSASEGLQSNNSNVEGRVFLHALKQGSGLLPNGFGIKA